MENYSDLKDYTISPDSGRVVDSVAAAERIFARKGREGKVELVQVIDHSGKPRLFWVCLKAGKAIATQPVFKEEENLKRAGCFAMQFCSGNELVCHDDVFYVTCRDLRKHIRIKMVQCFLNEKMVRLACELRGRRVVSLQLVKLYDIYTGKDLSVCWQVNYFKDVLDSGFFFVDLRDGIVLEDYDFSNAETYDVGIGDSFLAYNTYYTLKKSSEGLYLTRNPVQLALGGMY